MTLRRFRIAIEGVSQPTQALHNISPSISPLFTTTKATAYVVEASAKVLPRPMRGFRFLHFAYRFIPDKFFPLEVIVVFFVVWRLELSV